MSNNGNVGSNQSNRNNRTLMGISQAPAPKNTTTTTQADCNIFKPFSNLIQNISNYMYDEQTILSLNSGMQNYSTGQYFDNTQINSSWNYSSSNPKNFLTGQVAQMNLLNNDLQQYSNFNTIGNSSQATYNFDFTNGAQSTTNTNGLFIAIGPGYTNSTASGWNTLPNYNTSSDSSSYLLSASYMFTETQDLLMITIYLTISGTSNLDVTNLNTTAPSLFCKVKNTVYSRESLQNGGNSGAKVYEQTSRLRYNSSSTFDNTSTCFYMNNPVCIVFAPGFTPVIALMSMAYIPPIDKSGYYGQYLTGSPGSINDGYPFVSGLNSFDFSFLNISTQQTNYGYFIAGFAYSNANSYSTYLVGGIQEEIITKNIWRSPISIYNTYKDYSVLDSNGLYVTLLFAKTQSGALFLVTNTGTPISSVIGFGSTTLSNYINIMQAFFVEYNNTSSLVNYFIDTYTIAQLKIKGYNVNIVIFVPIIDSIAKIVNPNVDALPNITNFIIHQNNSMNISIDPTLQNVINQNIGPSYFGLANSELYSIGDNSYTDSKLNILSTHNNTLFGNAIYIGTTIINNNLYYISFILPESGFRPNYSSSDANLLEIYAAKNTAYYVNSSSGSTRFLPNSIQTNNTNQPRYDITKLQLSVSNNIIV